MDMPGLCIASLCLILTIGQTRKGTCCCMLMHAYVAKACATACITHDLV